MRVIAAVAAALCLGGATAPEYPMPDWLAGCWIEQKGAAWTEECWNSARGGVMIGSGRSGNAERVTNWESMQILRDPNGGLSFFAAPQGLNRTQFQRAAAPGPGVVFQNIRHNYPQRIRYWREGDALMAETALADGSRARRWKYRRM